VRPAPRYRSPLRGVEARGDRDSGAFLCTVGGAEGRHDFLALGADRGRMRNEQTSDLPTERRAANCVRLGRAVCVDRERLLNVGRQTGDELRVLGSGVAKQRLHA
jgi:hypothetical protein